MSCIYYYNSCGRCIHFVKTSKVEYEDDVLILTIPAMKLKNHEKICLCITEKIPEEDITPNTKVIVYVGDSTVKLTAITKYGNYLYADTLKTRRIYPLYVAVDTSALVLQDLSKLNGTDHAFEVIPAAKEKPL